MQVTSTVVDNVLAQCEDCGLTKNHITDGAFQCFMQDSHEVTFRARLHASPTANLTQLINYIIHWIETGASVAISGILLSVDRECDIAIESFSDPECTGHQLTTSQAITTVTTPTTGDSSVTMATSSLASPFSEITMPVIETTTFPPGRDTISYLLGFTTTFLVPMLIISDDVTVMVIIACIHTSTHIKNLYCDFYNIMILSFHRRGIYCKCNNSSSFCCPCKKPSYYHLYCYAYWHWDHSE